MNDITALAQRMKAAAEKATPGEWRAFTHPASGTYAVHTPKDKRCEDVIKWPGFDGRKNAGANANFVATANPANVLALVEALEKAQKSNQFLKDQLSELANFNPDWDKLEASYESWREIAAELLVAKDRIAELESRTVTVKLPADRAAESEISGYDGTEFYRSGWNARGKAVRDVLTAAGIQVIEGEA